MRAISSILFLVLASFLAATMAFAQKKEHRHHHAHSHGAANLSVAIDGLLGKVEFKGSAESVLGFEHEAKSEKDKAKLQETINVFENEGADLVSFEQTLGCVLSKEKAEMVRQKKSKHADFVATWNVTCSKPVAGSSLTLNFTKFPNLKKLSVQVLVDEIQKSAEVKSEPFTIVLK